MAHESQEADDKMWPPHVEHISIEIMLEEQLKDYDKLQQLFAPTTATGNLQISSNTPALDNDKERALEEELANASAPTHLDNDCYTPNFESFPHIVEDTKVEEPTQKGGKTSSVRWKWQGSLMASGKDWLRAFQQYDFDDAYFNDVASNDACEDNDDDWTNSKSDS
nr:hypothetical protein CFP56_65768 [Quercus suber]